MNRSKMTLALAVVAVAIVCVASAQAATITMTISYNTSYDSAFNPKGPELHALPDPAIGQTAPQPLASDIHQFDVFMTITGLPAGEDFQTAVFDAVLGPGVTPNLDSGAAYGGDNPLYDPPPNNSNGCASGCLSVLTQNGDAGVANDLKGITVIANATNSHQGTHIRHPGEAEPQVTDPIDNSNLAPPMFLGSIYVNWNGATNNASPFPFTFIGLSDPANVTTVWTSIDANNVAHAFTAADMNQGPNQNWANVPEPASLSLLGLAIVGALGLIRRR